jgi:DNA-binding FrmR family transcriptional regulator
MADTKLIQSRLAELRGEYRDELEAAQPCADVLAHLAATMSALEWVLQPEGVR